MKWTYEHPTKPGWYWVRNDKDSDAVIVQLSDKGGKMSASAGPLLVPIDFFACQFAGPLKAPK